MACACLSAPLVCSTNGRPSNEVAPPDRFLCLGVVANEFTERCNGIDDNCDGVLDEGTEIRCHTYDDVFVNVGACIEGLAWCNAAEGAGQESRRACEGEIGPRDEECNGVDDDCDGTVDERPDHTGSLVRACFPDFPGFETAQPGEGPCRRGSEDCMAGRWTGMCNGFRGPARDTCNASDDDCDGRTDETWHVGDACSDGVGECRDTDTIQCQGDGTSACNARAGMPRNETCDRRDNNCDGTTDEGFGLGEACMVGVGACQRSGHIECKADGRAGCDVQPARAGMEQCNSIDDDCDGRTDENVLNACGRCGAVPMERCNAQDDDCDGNTDEGFNLGAECMVGVGACQRTGQRVCLRDGTAGCDATAGMSTAEVCDMVDNDCNGAVDDGLAGIPETCNGEDDNCNGRIDENPRGVNQACDTGVPGICSPGLTRCRNGNLDCAATATAADETCNRLDDDCDGTVDEDVPVAAETCNGVDDNCDGTVDEGTCASARDNVCLGMAGCSCRAAMHRCAANERCTENGCEAP